MGYALKELRRHKARTAANLLGYAAAVAFMVIVMSLSYSYSSAAVGVLKVTGTHFIAFNPDAEGCCPDQYFGKGGPCAEGVYTALIDSSRLETIKGLPGVRDAAPYLLFGMYHGEGNFLTIGGSDLNSLATTTNVCASADLLQGRYLTPDDVNAVLLEESYARVKNILNVDDTINAFGREFRIVGIVNCGIKPAKADMYAPIEVVQEIVLQYSRCPVDVDMNVVLVEVADARMQEDVMNSVREVLGNATVSSYACYIPAREVIFILEKAAWAISLILVVAVILLAFKSQLASVVERIREIGILKSLGWSNSNIMRQILIESMVLATVGGMVGCGIAVIVISLLGWSVHYPAIVVGMILALIGGVLAGIFPAWRAGKLQPAEALRRFGGK